MRLGSRRLLTTLALLSWISACAVPAQTQPNIAGQVNGVFPEPAPLNFADHTGFVSLFNGKDLDGWDGEPGVWSVQDSAMRTTRATLPPPFRLR